MKKSIKLLSLFIFALVMMFVSKETVMAADSSPASFVASTYQMSYKPLGLTNTINVKKTTTGKYIYCLEVSKNLPNTSIVYTRGNVITDPAISYIIADGYNDRNDNQFFATQAALWIYLLDTNQMADTEYNYVRNIKNAVYSSYYANDSVAIDIKNILAGARSATVASNKAILDITNTSVNFNLVNNVYGSDTIYVNTNIPNANYNITLYNQPTGTTYNKVQNGFTVTVPANYVQAGNTTINAVVSGNATVYNVYKYNASNSNYQNMLTAYPETVNVSDTITLSINKQVPTTMIISKQDITTQSELPGATLAIRNSYGTIVKRWVTTYQPTTISDLQPGTYTLEEISAPYGYTLNTNKITFTVSNDSATRRLVMYNTPETVRDVIVSVSKKDITTAQELPGATLVIRDMYGTELYRWVSTNEPYIIRGLQEGTYTLEEISAPDGYTLSSEKITFEARNNGVITEVVMYNTPGTTEIITVPPTGSSASTILYILGGLVIIIGSVFVYKNVKKEQQQ